MKYLSLLLIVTGIALGLYVGGYLLLVGGIVDVAEFIRHDKAMDLVTGVLKILLAAPVGHLLAVVFIVPGIRIGAWSIINSKRRDVW